MTKTSDPRVVAGVDPQRSPEALRRLGRAVIGLARWQLDEAKSPSTVKRPSNTKASVSSERKRPGGGKL